MSDPGKSVSRNINKKVFKKINKTDSASAFSSMSITLNFENYLTLERVELV